jgi:hypothetical protein
MTGSWMRSWTINFDTNHIVYPNNNNLSCMNAIDCWPSLFCVWKCCVPLILIIIILKIFSTEQSISHCYWFIRHAVWRQNRYHAIQQLRFKLIKLIFCSKNCDDETGDRHSSARHTLRASILYYHGSEKCMGDRGHGKYPECRTPSVLQPRTGTRVPQVRAHLSNFVHVKVLIRLYYKLRKF